MADSTATVPANVARPIRGAGQGGAGYAIVSLIAAFHSFTPEQFGALVIAATVVVSFLHNLAEDKGWIPALLKSEPQIPAQTPVVDTTVSGPTPPKRKAKKA